MKRFRNAYNYTTKAFLIIAAFLLFVCVNANAMTITSNTTWGSSQTITNDLVIENGAILTITGSATVISVSGNVDVKPGSKLVVESNATLATEKSLILESSTSAFAFGAVLQASSGAIFTSLQGKWGGIQVWGPNNSFGLNIGAATALLDSVTVKKASLGVGTYNTESNNLYGGTLEATNTLFLNNSLACAIDMNPTNLVQNGQINTVPTNSSSYLKLCNFVINTTDNPFYPLPPGTVDLNTMLNVTDAAGVSVLGCSFDDQTPSPYSEGIVSYNSSIRVAPAYTPSSWGNFHLPDVHSCEFSNLVLGVYVAGPGGLSKVVVQESHFDHCGWSICFLDQSNMVIVDNAITNMENQFLSLDGVLLLNSTGYSVEGNNIDGGSEATDGIYVQNSGEVYNELYKNTISNTGVSIVASGTNRDEGGDKGLDILCNNFHKNDLQSSIGIYDTLYDPTKPNGIPSFQGVANPLHNYSTWIASGNLFPSITGPSYAPYYNDRVYNAPGCLLFTYGYSNANPDENPVYANVPLVIVDSNSCPTRSDFPYIIYSNFLVHVSNVENRIYDMEASDSLSRTDSIELSGLLMEHQKIIDSMMTTFMYGDSVTVHYDSMALALEHVQYGYYNKVKLAGVYLMQLRYDDAINLLSNIPLDYDLTTPQSSDVADLEEMYIVIDSLGHNENNWGALPAYLQQEVDSVAQSGGIYSSPVAHYLQARYEDDLYLPKHFHLSQGDSTDFYHKELIPAVNKIYPVPADNQLFVNWQSSDGKLTLKLYDISGKEVLVKPIYQGLNTLNIHGLASGIYMAQIFQNGRSVYHQKLIKK